MIAGSLIALSGVLLAIGVMAGRTAGRLWMWSTVAGAAAAGSAALAVLTTGPWEWRSGFTVAGEDVFLRLDAISALFIVLGAVVGCAGTFYAREYWSDHVHPRSARSGRMWWSALIASMGFVLLSSNGLHFLLGWEMFTVSSYFLITLERQKTEVRRAGWLYLGASHIATLCLFAFFVTLSAQTGSWEIGPMRERTELAPLYWLALFGFGVKAGIFPLHIWLPSAHANAPSHVSAIMSGVTIKLGIYGLVRFSGWMSVPTASGWAIAGLVTASAVLGVAFALGQHDLKRLLAYHSVENIGIILIGVGFAIVAAQRSDPAWGQVALAGGLLHVWNHGLFKSLLFLGAGAVLHATGTREMSRLGGLWRGMPWTATLFGLGAAAISGLPPLNGFVSEWLVYLGLFDAVNAHGIPALGAVLAAVLLAVTGALALACFIKVCGVVFLGAPRSAAAELAHECGAWMRGPMIGLAFACTAIGLAPVLFWPAVASAATAWNPGWSNVPAPASLPILGGFHVALASAAVIATFALLRVSRIRGIRRALTWDCGYQTPTARMQYTGGSFAGTITEWFAWILRPRRHADLPTDTFAKTGSVEVHTPETVLDYIVVPASRAVMHVARLARRLQHGRIQAYLVYLVVGCAVLAGIAIWGAPR
jgi:hydrogenase-4 component B